MVLKRKHELNQKSITYNTLVVVRGRAGRGCEEDKGVQKGQASSYKINKSWVCHVQQGDYNY